MSSSNHESDPQNLPVKSPGRSDDIIHQSHEWSSGTRGGGKVPKDFAWKSNPKQQQEENGSGEAEQPISK